MIISKYCTFYQKEFFCLKRLLERLEKSSQGCFWLKQLVQMRKMPADDSTTISLPQSFGVLIVLLPLPSPVALLRLCPIPGWIATSSSVLSVVTFSGTLMQWDIAQFGSTRRATAKARTQPLWIYHPNKRPLPRGATQEYIKLQHNSRSLLQVFCPPTRFSHRNKSLEVWNFVKFVQMSCFIHKMSMFHYSGRIMQRTHDYTTISKRKQGCVGQDKFNQQLMTQVCHWEGSLF